MLGDSDSSDGDGGCLPSAVHLLWLSDLRSRTEIRGENDEAEKNPVESVDHIP